MTIPGMAVITTKTEECRIRLVKFESQSRRVVAKFRTGSVHSELSNKYLSKYLNMDLLFLQKKIRLCYL